MGIRGRKRGKAASKRPRTTSSKTTARASKPATPTQAKTLTRLELAKVLDIGPQRLAKYVEDGMPVAERGRGGRASRYDPAAVRAWLEERGKVGTGEQKVGTASAVAAVAMARARKEQAQAALAEQLQAVRAREFLPRAEVKRAWEGIVTAVRTKLLAAPETHADRLLRAVELGGRPALVQAFMEVNREICRELAGTEIETTPPGARSDEEVA